MLQIVVNLFTKFSRKERIAFIAAFFVFIVSSILLTISLIQQNTVLLPVEGGEYAEGIVGQPIFINPLYADNNAPDTDLSRLLFANMNAIIEKEDLSPDQKTYDIRIKGDITWQDGQPITTDDIIFTIGLIQDPDVNSPLAAAWKGVQIERISEREMQIVAPATYSYFEKTILSLQPIPKHLFDSIPSANIRLSGYNIEPIGSGPYKFDSFQKRRDGFITQITMKKNDSYFGDKAYIKTFVAKFFQDEGSAVTALNDGDIDGMSVVDPDNIKKISIPHQTRTIEIPRYYAIFPNAFANPLLGQKDIVQALDLATDKEAITKQVFGDNAIAITGPIPPFTVEDQGMPNYSLDRAKDLLESDGWHMTESGIRQKDGHDLTFVLTVYPSPFLQKTATLLQGQWKQAGIDVRINMASPSDFNQAVIKSRDYELLIFGNTYGENVDAYSFWHSSQKLAPGLNLSLYSNKDADTLIEHLRQDFDPASRKVGLYQLQQIISGDHPAVFLYSPYYLYVSNKSLKGFDGTALGIPSDRFDNVSKWYIKTVRTLKK